MKSNNRIKTDCVFIFVMLLCAFFASTGPVLTVTGFILLFLTGWHISRALLPCYSIVILPAVWLMCCLEVMALGELLSLFSMLSNAKAWLGMQLVIYIFARLALPSMSDADSFGFLKFRRFFDRLPAFAKAFIVSFGFFSLVSFVTALYSGVTVWDSVLWYMPVIIKYFQQGSFIINPDDLPHPSKMHVMVTMGWHTMYIYTMALTGGIKLLNLLGWISTHMALITTYFICREAELSRAHSLLASIVVFCAPIAVVQASNTNYDQQAGFAMAMTALFAMYAFKQPSLKTLFLFAAAQAVLVSSKLTALYVLPIIIVLDIAVIIRCIKFKQTRHAVGYISSVILLISILIVPHFIRINSAYDTAFAGAEKIGTRSLSESLITLSARSVQMLIPFELGALRSEKGSLLYSALPDFPDDMNFRDYKFKDMITVQIRHPNADTAYFGFLPLLITIMLIALLFLKRHGHKISDAQKWILLAGVTGWIVFQICFAIKFPWTPYNSRYMLIMWFMAAPVFGILLTRFNNKMRNIILAFAMTAALIEYGGMLLINKTKTVPPIMSISQGKHMGYYLDSLGVKYAEMKNPLAGLQELLNEKNIAEIQYNVKTSFLLLYMDDILKRRLVYNPNLKLDGTSAVITKLADGYPNTDLLRTLGQKYSLHFMRKWDNDNVLLIPKN